MRKVSGVKSLIDYLNKVNYPMTEEKIIDLLSSKALPHQRLVNNMIIFNLDHIDWWINEQRTNS